MKQQNFSICINFLKKFILFTTNFFFYLNLKCAHKLCSCGIKFRSNKIHLSLDSSEKQVLSLCGILMFLFEIYWLECAWEELEFSTILLEWRKIWHVEMVDWQSSFDVDDDDATERRVFKFWIFVLGHHLCAFYCETNCSIFSKWKEFTRLICFNFLHVFVF